MQSASLSPRKKLIRKNSKTSPAKPKLTKAKSMSVKVGSYTSFSLDKTQETKSIQEIQNQLEKLSHNDKLSEVQSITIGQLKKICNFVNDKQSVSKLQLLMEEEKVGQMSTQEVDEHREEPHENIIDLEQMLGEKINFGISLPNQNNVWTTGLVEVQQPALEPWWSMKEDDSGARLDFF